MKKILPFVLCLVILPMLSYADNSPSDTHNESINAETNMSELEDSIRINEEEFSQLVEQVKKRYTDFDWDKFDTLDSRTQRMVMRNYLARIAFDEILEKYKKDIRARAKDGVNTEKYGGETTYFNKSDAKYRTLFVTEQELAEKAKVSNKCDGCSWTYFKQQDIKKLDELIKQETAKSPVEMHCEKYCAVLDQEREDDGKQFLSKYNEFLEKYKKIQKQYLSDLRKYGASRKEIKEERKKVADEIRKLDEEYANWKKLIKDSIGWYIRPYNTTCEMVTVGCWNVEKIPLKYERFELDISDWQDIISVHYAYDDIASDTHTEISAWRDCTCDSDINDLETNIDCNCAISFFDEIQDFAAVRNWENQTRIDIKNGINQDKNENGGWKHDWASNIIPGGYVSGRSFDLSGNVTKSVTKEETK